VLQHQTEAAANAIFEYCKVGQMFSNSIIRVAISAKPKAAWFDH
jgi:hypothetical protein